jgi:hypothetical protein
MPAGASGGVLCLSPFSRSGEKGESGGTGEQRRASTATQTLSGASHPGPSGLPFGTGERVALRSDEAAGVHAAAPPTRPEQTLLGAQLQSTRSGRS